MSFRTNENQQMGIHDSLNGLSEREMRILTGSWAEEFSMHIFPNLAEDPFSVLFSENDRSKPNAPVNVILGMLMLKEQFDMTDEETVEQLLFNVQWQYALRTTSFVEQPVNENTLRIFRNRVAAYEKATGIDLVRVAFDALRDSLAEIMGMSLLVKRVDSLMISAGCKRLSRLNIMGETLRLAAREIARVGHADELTEKYWDENKVGGAAKDLGYRLKRDEIPGKMEEMLRDAAAMLEACPEALAGSDAIASLRRMIGDQGRDNGEGGLALKDGKDISPESMQTPHDPEATYRTKGGKGYVGYVANIEEACDGDRRLITGYDLQQNTYSDAEFAEDIVDAAPEGGESQTVIVDGSYASTDLIGKAEAKNVAIATTSLIGGMNGTFEARFEFDEEGRIVACPVGQSPMDSKRGDGTYQAHFDPDVCEACPYCDRCPGVFQVRAALIKFSDAALIKAQYAEKAGSDEYRALANLRNGVEGVQSVLRRKYDVDRMRQKGAVRKRQRLGLKLMAMNARKLFSWMANTEEQMAAA